MEKNKGDVKTGAEDADLIDEDLELDDEHAGKVTGGTTKKSNYVGY
jgi:hypothetical protein